MRNAECDKCGRVLFPVQRYCIECGTKNPAFKEGDPGNEDFNCGENDTHVFSKSKKRIIGFVLFCPSCGKKVEFR